MVPSFRSPPTLSSASFCWDFLKFEGWISRHSVLKLRYSRLAAGMDPPSPILHDLGDDETMALAARGLEVSDIGRRRTT